MGVVSRIRKIQTILALDQLYICGYFWSPCCRDHQIPVCWTAHFESRSKDIFAKWLFTHKVPSSVQTSVVLFVVVAAEKRLNFFSFLFAVQALLW
jgi:hypothetical protein